MMNYNQRRLRALIDKLRHDTFAGKIDWKLTTKNSALAEFQSGHVEISWGEDENGQDAVRLALQDYGSAEGMSFDDTDLTYRDNLGNLNTYYNEMEELITAALRYAKGEERILDKFLSELGVTVEKDDDQPFF